MWKLRRLRGNQFGGATGKTIAIAFAVGAFVLFVLAISVYEGWVAASLLDNQQAPALAVYGVLLGGAAYGVSKADI